MPPLIECGEKAQSFNSEAYNTTGVLFECDADMIDGGLLSKKSSASGKNNEEYKYELVWRNIIGFAILHVAAVYGASLLITSALWKTRAFFTVILLLNGFGITGGAHRLWAHRSYKAIWQLRIFLMICNTIAFQDSVYTWARDHRVHHKFSETNADPHNANRGLFFSHVGWLLCKKHPDVVSKGKLIDLSDLHADPIVMFQKKYYIPLVLLACFILPTIIPMYFWNETFLNSLFICSIFRWCTALNCTWCVNSAAHFFGFKPYDKSINPSENFGVSIVSLGEGWHNYHHVFPWDYKAAEWNGSFLNSTTFWINYFAKIGWAYDLKSVNQDVVERRVKRTGDGTHPIWGWGDKDIPESEKAEVLITNTKHC